MRYFHCSTKSVSVIRTKRDSYPSEVQAKYLSKVFQWIFGNDPATVNFNLSNAAQLRGESHELPERNRVIEVAEFKLEALTHHLQGWQVKDIQREFTPSEMRMLDDFLIWFMSGSLKGLPNDASYEDKDMAARPVWLACNLNDGRTHAFVRR